jgi:S1-C subfamily serine protease
MRFLTYLTLIVVSLVGFSQNLKIKNDTIFVGNKAIGLKVVSKKKKIAFLKLEEDKLKFQNFLLASQDINKVMWDPYLFDDLLVFNISEGKVEFKNLVVGSLSFTIEHNLRLLSIIIFKSSISRPFVKYCVKKSDLKYQYKIDYDLTRERELIAAERREREAERREREAEMEAAKIRRERQRIDRFYAQILDILEGKLDQIEGVYKSIDQGEGDDYDIVIVKSNNKRSNNNSTDYTAMTLSSTNKVNIVGSDLFSIKKTAQKNLFFVEYNTTKGEFVENKTATLNGAMLVMGIKSFIKMYPVEGEKKRYQEINPMVDWESSGSGVLINSSGYLATNNHVIKGAKSIRVAFQNDNIDYNASVISQNEINDVAIIKIVDERFSKKLEPINWNTDYKLGQKVFTLGYPISHKMSDNVKVVDGIVSGINGRDGIKTFFQTTLPVWYGNSGGPCFNDKGEILGLATQILFDREAKVDNVAYITKSQNILSLSGDLIDQENIVKNDGIKEDANSYGLEELIEKLVPYSAFIKVNY